MMKRVVRKLFPVVAMLSAMPSCSLIRLSDPPDSVVVATRMRAQAARSQAPDRGRPTHTTVWLIADTLHTGLVFESDWLIESGFVPPENFPKAKYVTMSWGDRNAYVNRRLASVWDVVNALFLPSESVMELIPADWHVTEVCPNQRIWQKRLPRDVGPELAAFLNHCSIHDGLGRPVVVGESSWGGGVLLQSRHVYFYPRVCNIWTVQAMQAMGARMNPWMGISAGGVIRQAGNSRNRYSQIWWGRGTAKPQ